MRQFVNEAMRLVVSCISVSDLQAEGFVLHSYIVGARVSSSIMCPALRRTGPVSIVSIWRGLLLFSADLCSSETGPEVMPLQALRNGLVRILPLYSDERVGAASTGAERVRIT
jgi:hypothetical protein